VIDPSAAVTITASVNVIQRNYTPPQNVFGRVSVSTSSVAIHVSKLVENLVVTAMLKFKASSWHAATPLIASVALKLWIEKVSNATLVPGVIFNYGRAVKLYNRFYTGYELCRSFTRNLPVLARYLLTAE
jgi:hypothetical protein